MTEDQKRFITTLVVFALLGTIFGILLGYSP